VDSAVGGRVVPVLLAVRAAAPGAAVPVQAAIARSAQDREVAGLRQAQAKWNCMFKVIDVDAAIPYGLPEPDERNVWVLGHGGCDTAPLKLLFLGSFQLPMISACSSQLVPYGACCLPLRARDTFSSGLGEICPRSGRGCCMGILHPASLLWKSFS
jgi:hypothetical protein